MTRTRIFTRGQRRPDLRGTPCCGGPLRVRVPSRLTLRSPILQGSRSLPHLRLMPFTWAVSRAKSPLAPLRQRGVGGICSNAEVIIEPYVNGIASRPDPPPRQPKVLDRLRDALRSGHSSRFGIRSQHTCSRRAAISGPTRKPDNHPKALDTRRNPLRLHLSRPRLRRS